ncbi:MAG: FtsW/RodA/SpoVE family cell cycle protein [bacterium]|nr:FtsW/RodA/SpoVE family cell cycle protein [bacterium]
MRILGKLSQNNSNSVYVRLPFGVCFFTLSLVFIGIINIASAARLTRPNLFLVQLLWLGIGILLAVGIAFVRTSSLKLIAYPFYGFVVFLLLLVLVMGTSAKGSQRWLEFGLFRLQPSELMKIAIVFATASFCTDYEIAGGYRLRDLIRPFNLSRPILFLFLLIFVFFKGKLSEWAPFLGEENSPKILLLVGVCLLFVCIWFFIALLQLRKEGWHIYQLVALIDIVIIPFALILAQPDLGTGTIVLTISASIILFCGMRFKSILIAALFGVGIAIVGWNFVLKDYQKQRVESFLNPEADIRGHGYHAAQSIIAIGSGQIFGKGIGEGTQTQLSFLPENHTDFIFAVLAEEWGFLFCLLVLLLFFGLITSMLKVGFKSQDRFGSLLVVGAAAIVFWHVTINVGMVIGILPVVGVTLPFVSYGGASFMTKMIAVGFCLNVAIWRRI